MGMEGWAGSLGLPVPTVGPPTSHPPFPGLHLPTCKMGMLEWVVSIDLISL